MSQFSRDINLIDRCLRQRRRDYMEPLGLKGIHARLIMHICRTPGCSQDQLAKRMGFDKSTIARQAELLENMDFVIRKPSEKDKRVLCVHPTERMQEFWPGLEAAMEAWDAELVQELTPQEREQLTTLLGRIAQKVRAEVQP